MFILIILIRLWLQPPNPPTFTYAYRLMKLLFFFLHFDLASREEVRQSVVPSVFTLDSLISCPETIFSFISSIILSLGIKTLFNGHHLFLRLRRRLFGLFCLFLEFLLLFLFLKDDVLFFERRFSCE